jgi:hypothetical protein
VSPAEPRRASGSGHQSVRDDGELMWITAV